MMEDMGIGNSVEMKACVSRRIWHDRLLGRSHKMLWDEVEAKRTALGTIGETASGCVQTLAVGLQMKSVASSTVRVEIGISRNTQ
jgi:hypothetical protein